MCGLSDAANARCRAGDCGRLTSNYEDISMDVLIGDDVRLSHGVVDLAEPGIVDGGEHAGWPVVYGYLRIDGRDTTALAALCAELTWYCLDNGFELGPVFADRDVADEEYRRAEFGDLLAAVRDSPAETVVVPTLDHLSPQPFVLDALLRSVRLTGTRVLVMDGSQAPEPHAQAGGGT
jgi:hypothetical protein